MYYDFYQNREAGRLAAIQAKRLIPSLAGKALRGLPQNLSVLEIGVGRGDFAKYLKNFGAEYTGIEANEFLAQQLKSNGFEIYCANIPPFPSELKKESFDLVVMCHIFEHFKDFQEALKVLSEILALLKPGGRLLLFHPDYLDWGADYFDGDYSHSLILTRNRVDCLAQDAGFKIILRDSYRSFFCSLKAFSWCLARFMNCFFGALLCITGNRKFFKPKIAFNSNLLTVCEKQK